MANTYRTAGSLTTPVSDLAAARTYLAAEDMGGMTQFVKYASHPALEEVVHHIEWTLLDEGSWQVTVITHRELHEDESSALSEWISGQNSDGLGEGFEQQPWAEHGGGNGYDEDDEEDYSMSSFDWETNDCSLTLIK
jgi:hypothetical protein